MKYPNWINFDNFSERTGILVLFATGGWVGVLTADIVDIVYIIRIGVAYIMEMFWFSILCVCHLHFMSKCNIENGNMRIRETNNIIKVNKYVRCGL